jgi:hypothetical protein
MNFEELKGKIQEDVTALEQATNRLELLIQFLSEKYNDSALHYLNIEFFIQETASIRNELFVLDDFCQLHSLAKPFNLQDYSGLDLPSDPILLSDGSEQTNTSTQNVGYTDEEIRLLSPLSNYLYSLLSDIREHQYQLSNSFTSLTYPILSSLGQTVQDYPENMKLTDFINESGVDVNALDFQLLSSDEVNKLYGFITISYNPEDQDLSSPETPKKTDVIQEDIIRPFGRNISQMTADYTKLWDERRILIDLIQNHLPLDSGGKNTILQFHVVEGTHKEGWYDISEIGGFTDQEIDGFQIIDDGVGYQKEYLYYYASNKSEESAGKFGEGLKVALGAALARGCKVEVQSHYEPEAGSQNEPLDWSATEELAESGAIRPIIVDYREGADIKKGSLTRVMNINPAFVRQLRNIRESVLYFHPSKPVAETMYGSILELEPADIMQASGRVYVKGLLWPDNKDTIFSYNFTHLDVKNRDRLCLERWSELIPAIESVLSDLSDKKVIKQILQTISNYSSTEREYAELSAVIFHDYNIYHPDILQAWLESFKEVFGERACVIARNSSNPAACDYARHMGLIPIVLPNSWALALSRVRGKDGEKILSYEEEHDSAIRNAVPVPANEITEDEKIVVDWLLHDIVTLLPHENGKPRISNIEIYDYPKDYFGSKAAGFAKLGDTIHICRDTFTNIFDLLHVVFHESGHAYTGAGDPDKEFRDFLSRVLAIQAANNVLGPERLSQIRSLSRFATRPEPSAMEEFFYDAFKPFQDPYTFQFLSKTDSTPSELGPFAKLLSEMGYGSKMDELKRDIDSFISRLEGKGYNLEQITRVLEMRKREVNPEE